MHAWFELIGSVLRPRRSGLERCRQEREGYVVARRAKSERTTRAVKDCERSIETLRAQLFAANDGFVGARMTELERTWRTLSRVDPDAGLMDLWARIAPASWIDQKRWRGSSSTTRLDAATLLAADVSGVEAAESAVRSLGLALAAWGTPLGSRIQWRLPDEETQDRPDHAEALLATPLRAASEALVASDVEEIVVGRARRFQDEVREAARSRIPERPDLVRSIAHAAFVDYLFDAVARGSDARSAQRGLGDRPNPVVPLSALWATGYAIAAVDSSGVTLEIPA